ncbi:MAG: hypothetical protein HY722_15525 [Planctomycetes bacterium]|nr:hypothetical protein [Planctomycetota bacterium]
MDEAPLPLAARWTLALIYLLLALVGWTYRRGQNRQDRAGQTVGHGGARHKLGGPISRAKTLWLLYTLAVWFTLCPVVALWSDAAYPLRLVLGAFAAWMWARGLAEMVMLYGTRNWTPPLGVAHDLSCLLLVAAGLAWFHSELATLRRPFDLWTLGLTASVLLSLVLEVYYALAFFAIVRGRTRGDDALWFADDQDPRFRRINRHTALGNTVLYAALLGYLGAGHGLW